MYVGFWRKQGNAFKKKQRTSATTKDAEDPHLSFSPTVTYQWPIAKQNYLSEIRT